MKTTVMLAAAVLLGIPLTGVAANEAENCLKIAFNQEFLEKFPDAGAACQEIKVVNGQKWARFNAEVHSNKDGHITVGFLNKAQHDMEKPMTFAYTPDATLTLENKEAKAASAVKKGDRVEVWVPESRFGLYAQPGDVESKQFAVVSDSTKKM